MFPVDLGCGERGGRRRGGGVARGRAAARGAARRVRERQRDVAPRGAVARHGAAGARAPPLAARRALAHRAHRARAAALCG